MEQNDYIKTTYFQQFIKIIPIILLVSLFFGMAAMFNAGMDTLDHHRSVSIFVEWGEYWDDNWLLKYDENGNQKYFMDIKFSLFKHPAFFDAWHLFKVFMIGSFITVILLLIYKRNRIIFDKRQWEHWAVLLIIFVWLSLVWNVIFNLFYDKVLVL